MTVQQVHTLDTINGNDTFLYFFRECLSRFEPRRFSYLHLPATGVRISLHLNVIDNSSLLFTGLGALIRVER